MKEFGMDTNFEQHTFKSGAPVAELLYSSNSSHIAELSCDQSVVESTASSTSQSELSPDIPLITLLADRFEECLAAGKSFWRGDVVDNLASTQFQVSNVCDEPNNTSQLDLGCVPTRANFPATGLPVNNLDLLQLQTKMEALENHIALLSKVINGQPSLISAIPTTTNSPIQYDDREYGLSNQFELFLEEQKRNVAANTITGYETRFIVLFEIMGRDFDCRLMGKAEVQKIKNELLTRNVNHKTAKIKKKIDVKTLNQYLSNYRTFYSWLRKNIEGVQSNPFADVSLKKNKMVAVKRRPFSESEIEKILHYEFRHGTEARAIRKDLRWFIPVSFYSGMRLNEVSQLRLNDIKREQGVWCFDLRASEVKNLSSRRLVPIAQYLIDEGLLDYVKSLNARKKEWLFYQIREKRDEPGSSGWGDAVSRWFNRLLLTNIGIDRAEEERKRTTVVFHCIRHTVINTCIRKGVQKHLIKRIVGHSQDDEITLGVYADVNDISLSLLKSVLDDNLLWHQAKLTRD